MNDTIFAVASGAGRAAVALVRISGDRSAEVSQAIVGRVPAARVATYCTLRSPFDQTILDKAVATYFRGPASYTGEDQLELALHGGPAIVSGVLEVLQALGLRPAQPGEFTRRAFEFGKLDLTEAEAVADLVDAQTCAQRDQAIAQLGGALSRSQEGWRNALIEAAALLEVQIDFPDEDLPDGLSEAARQPLERVRKELRDALNNRRGEQVREGYRIALLGAPNAGKSSIMNALLERDAVIVTDIAGTTRDVIEAHLNIEGYQVVIADMAGMRISDDPVEKEGIRRALAWSADAALRLLILDQYDENCEWCSSAELMQDGDILVLNKSDLNLRKAARQAIIWAAENGIAVVSCQANLSDVRQLREVLRLKVVNALQGGELTVVTRTRHRAILKQALGHLDRAFDPQNTAEAVAEDIRLSGRALEQLVGRVDTENILDRVFSLFCLGK